MRKLQSERSRKIKTKKSQKKKTVSSASAKSVETMFRNAYRAQLDMISLAATKANIMISLNGVIVSILMVTGGFIYANSPELLLPAILLLITSAISIYFALSAASPSPAPAHTRVFCCLRDVLKGKASLRDFKNYVKLPEKRFSQDTSNILIFDDFASLPKEKYIEYMNELIHNPDKVYEKMSDQLYWLGIMANKKFASLRYSYTVFRWGLILSILVFVGIKSVQHFYPHQQGQTAKPVSANSEMLSFDKIYEPSGVQQLPDGRLAIIEDEPEFPIHILNINQHAIHNTSQNTRQDTNLSENISLGAMLRIAFGRKLDDLEAITSGPDGYLYAATSHKRNKKGKRRADRELLVRFKIKGNKIVNTGIVTNLYDAIEASGVLGRVDKQGKGGLYNLNIEALSFDANNRLMIGLRNPLINGKSVILLLTNPVGVFKNKEIPVVSRQAVLLDLQGSGIRAMSYDKILNGYLITNEIYVSDRNNAKYSQLSFWDGDKNHKPRAIELPDLKTINNIEGIAPVTINGETRLILVCDNGDRRLYRPANYLFLEYRQIISGLRDAA